MLLTIPDEIKHKIDDATADKALIVAEKLVEFFRRERIQTHVAVMGAAIFVESVNEIIEENKRAGRV